MAEIEIQERDGMQHVCLGGGLTIEAVSAVAEGLSRGLRAGGGVCVRFDGDPDVDLTVLQVFCAAHRMAVRDGCSFSLAGPLPPRVAEAVRLAGFHRLAGCPLVESGCLWVAEEGDRE